jgi:hypothetical protein
MQTVCLHAPSPSFPVALASAPPLPVCTLPCTPRVRVGRPLSSPFRMGVVAPHPCAQTGSAGRHTKGTPPPPLAPTQLTRTAQRARDPHRTPFDHAPILANGGPSFAPTRHRNAGPHNTTPAPCDPLTHMSGVHERARVCPPPPHPSDERAQGWAAPWETTPSALIHARTGRRPHFRLPTLPGVDRERRAQTGAVVCAPHCA